MYAFTIATFHGWKETISQFLGFHANMIATKKAIHEIATVPVSTTFFKGQHRSIANARFCCLATKRCWYQLLMRWPRNLQNIFVQLLRLFSIAWQFDAHNSYIRFSNRTFYGFWDEQRTTALDEARRTSASSRITLLPVPE